MTNLIEGADYFVHMVDFPTCRCGGTVTPNDDGTYTVLINSRLSHQQNVDSCTHERNHMAHDDHWREDSIEDMEREAG